MAGILCIEIGHEFGSINTGKHNSILQVKVLTHTHSESILYLLFFNSTGLFRGLPVEGNSILTTGRPC